MGEWKDGYYDYNDVKSALNKDFMSEKELCDYIENNMTDFCIDCLNIIPDTYSREYPMNGKFRARHKGNRRLDFLIKSTSGQNIALECKSPTHQCELAYAIGQSLSYIALFELMELKVDRFIIVSTKIDSILPLTISRFNLPIEFIAFDKDKFLTYIPNGSTFRK